jgi:hypothetical protein
MIGGYLMRGLLCGLLGGLCAFLFAHAFGEPQITQAIAFETQRQIASGEPAGPEIFSRAVQSGIGLFTAVMVVGTALGGAFSIACAFAYGRMGRLSTRASTAILALIAFVVVDLAPGLKYPANPPSVGLPATIGLRTELFFSMIAISIVFAVLAALIRSASLAKLGAWNATILGALAYLGLVTFAQILLPDINEVPATFSATVLWSFRVASIGTIAVMWSVIGLVFGALTERSEHDAWTPGTNVGTRLTGTP